MDNIYALSDYHIRIRLGEKLKRTRVRQNISQEKLAEMSSLSRSSIQALETGKPVTFDSFIRVLRMLGLLDALASLVEEDEMSPSEYYEFLQSAKKNEKKRASKPRKTSGSQNSEKHD